MNHNEVKLIDWLADHRNEDRLKIGRHGIEFLLLHGSFCRPAHCISKIWPSEANACFFNALRLAKASKGEMIYCEGFSLPPMSAEAALRGPRLHAWCLNPSGGVVEGTWNQLGQLYFGVCFAPTATSELGFEANDLGLLRPHNLERLPGNWKYEMPPDGR